MTKESKDALYTIGIGAALIILYLVFQKTQPAKPVDMAATSSNPLPVGWQEPMNSVYGANPSAYQPASPLSLTVNVPNQMANFLTNSYIPLYGMVGMAQGQLYQ